jgi:hypothetical protein
MPVTVRPSTAIEVEPMCGLLTRDEGSQVITQTTPDSPTSTCISR